MNQDAILVPFVGTMLLTLGVWIYMYARRIPFIRRSNFTPEQFVPAEFTRLSPPSVANPSDNLKNLFELPTIFYAVVLYLFVAQQVDGTYVAAAWIFFVFRVLHSVVHCTFNRVLLRFALYAVSAVALWTMVLRMTWHVVG